MGLFPPPTEMKTEVFTEVPREFRATGRISEWGAYNKPGQQLHSFLEGPSFDRAGRLYVTDLAFGRIFRVSSDGKWELIAEYDGWPNGLKIHRDGRIFITDQKLGVLLLDPDSGKTSPFITYFHSEGLKGVNDLFFDTKGRLYFTDQGQSGLHDPTGRVFRVDLETMRMDCLIDNCPSPNGLVMNHEESQLLVGMTRSNDVWRLPFLGDGAVSKVGIFVRLAGGVSGPDGLALDAEGRLFVCDAGQGCVWVFTRFGEPVYRIRACTGGRTLTNMAFGGKDNRTLFVTDASTGSILAAEMDVSGRPMYSHAAA